VVHVMQIVVVTGVSGAGKSTALHALEDLGHYCVDNLPLPLLSKFIELAAASGVSRAALVVDTREGEFLLGAGEAMRALRSSGHEVHVMFLDAPDDVLMRRFSETRRRHPLAGDDLALGLRRERNLLTGLREESDAVVDTGRLSVHDLKGIVQERYGHKGGGRLGLSLVSFGFKHGLPSEADVVLDVRFLPNPYFVEALSSHTGLDEPVALFVLDNNDAREFVQHAVELLAFLVPRCEAGGKPYLTVGIGCTGGRHRSVAVAEALAREVSAKVPVTVRHRDIDRK
jgi:RNase adapter protein RapZ